MVRSGFKNLIAFCLLFSAFLLLLNADTTFAGSVTLSWTPPTTNMDSTPLTDLAGFKIYYGTSSGYYAQSIDIGMTNTPNAPQYTVNNLTDGQTYYFAVTAYDASNNESGYSNMACRTIGTITCNSTTGGDNGGEGNNSPSTDIQGSGCGFVKDGNYGKGQKAKGELLSIAMLLLLLFLLRLRKGSQQKIKKEGTMYIFTIFRKMIIPHSTLKCNK